jgi:hypothetical protein
MMTEIIRKRLETPTVPKQPQSHCRLASTYRYCTTGTVFMPAAARACGTPLPGASSWSIVNTGPRVRHQKRIVTALRHRVKVHARLHASHFIIRERTNPDKKLEIDVLSNGTTTI